MYTPGLNPEEPTSDSDPEEKGDEPSNKHTNLNLDEWISFKVDAEVRFAV